LRRRWPGVSASLRPWRPRSAHAGPQTQITDCSNAARARAARSRHPHSPPSGSRPRRRCHVRSPARPADAGHL